MLFSHYTAYRGWIPLEYTHPIFPPVEHALVLGSEVLLGAAFLNLVQGKAYFVNRFILVGLAVDAVLWIATGVAWPLYLAGHPDATFGVFWGDLLFRSIATIITGTILVSCLICRKRGRYISWLIVSAFMFLFMDEALMVISLLQHEVHKHVFNPIRHNLHIWAIPMVIAAYVIDLRKRVQQLAERERNLYRLSPNVLGVVGLDHRFVAVSPASKRVFLRDPEEVIGLTVEEFGMDSQCFNELVHQLQSSPETEISSYVFPHDTLVGRRWLRWRFRPLDDHKVFFVSVEDITEQRKAHEALSAYSIQLERSVQERNAELEAFTYSVSHDLQAPLRAIEGFASIIEEEYADKLSAEAQDYINRIRLAAKSTMNLIRALLKLSRLGHKTLEITELDMQELVGIAREELEPQLRGRLVNWRIAELPRLAGDYSMLLEVWRNLLSNAVKYTQDRQPAVIEIGVVENEDGFQFWVKDNGCGFDMNYADKLFVPFQRLHAAADYPGSGVGLSIVKRIIERHGGTITARSSPGEGATFIFTLPRHPVSSTVPSGHWPGEIDST